jgi:hypothetical protein
LILGFIINIVLVNIIYLKQKKALSTTLLFSFMLGILYLAAQYSFHVLRSYAPSEAAKYYYTVMVLILMLALAIVFYITNQNRAVKALQYYLFMFFALATLFSYRLEHLLVWGVLLLFVFAKLGKQIEYEAMNVIMTFLALVVALTDVENWLVWVYLACAVLSIPLIRRWRLFYQYALSIYFVLFAIDQIPSATTGNEIYLPAIAGIMLVLMPAFRFLVRVKEIGSMSDRVVSLIYNLSNLSVLAIVSLLCIDSEQVYTAPIVAAVGAVWLIFCLSPSFYMGFKEKYLALAAYLAFMTFAVPFSTPIIVSIILMVIALFCVIMGFGKHDKAQRFCGLVLALFVCAKIVLYDFRGLEALQKTIVFMVVGVLAMVIALIYMRLEKGREAIAKQSSDKSPE